MEENSTTMNLGNLQAGGIPAQEIPVTNEVVAPVSDININPVTVDIPTTQTQVAVAPEQSNLTQAQPQYEQPIAAPVFTPNPVQAVAQPQPPTPPVNNEPEEKKVEEPADQSIARVKTVVLQDMLSKVTNVINYDNRFEISTVVQLIFSSVGLEVKSANGAESYIYQKNNEWTYSSLGEYSICFDSQFLYQLISKITAPVIIFERSQTDSRIILIKVEGSEAEFRTAEKLDPNSGESINVEIPDEMSFEGIQSIPLVNAVKFKQALDKCIPFAAESSAREAYNGVYCGSNYIIGTNGDSICIVDSIPEFNNSVLFITKDFANKLTRINFEGDTDISWKASEGRKYPSLLKLHNINNENKTEILIIGRLQEDEYYDNFPVQAADDFKRMEFKQTFTTSRIDFKEAIDRASLFFRLVDQNQLTIAITPGALNIKSLSGGSEENIKLEGCTQSLGTFRMDATQANKMLDILSSNIVTIKADIDHKGLMSIIDENCLIILSEANGV